MSKGFNGLIEKVNTCGVKKVAVAVAQDAHVLEAVTAWKLFLLHQLLPYTLVMNGR